MRNLEEILELLPPFIVIKGIKTPLTLKRAQGQNFNEDYFYYQNACGCFFSTKREPGESLTDCAERFLKKIKKTC